MLVALLELPRLPDIAVSPKSSPTVKAAFRRRLSELGWAMEPLVHPHYKLTINALKDGVGLTVQTGNVTRAFYDLMKFQSMYLRESIEAAVLIVPTLGAADTMGDNVANFSRITDELHLFRHVITVPCFVMGFE